MRPRSKTVVICRREGRLVLCTAWLIVCWCACLACAAEPGAIQFNRDIRPILSDSCFQCHGPDAAQRKADLRLDIESSAKGELNGTRIIAPGKPGDSELVQRISGAHSEQRMPPPTSGKKLTAAQVGLLTRWVVEGAQWEKHWAFIPPTRPDIPRVKHADRVRNPIDALVLQRLEAAGLEPSPEADKSTLIRRVTLDLTGLPPTPQECDAFLADNSADAYGRLVDRLLASPRYGERMAARWLDAARYADTSGYQTDGVRYMWRWRDWVIEAFNRNLPFDRFTIEQIAGDMLPGATLDQRIATGFNRNHRGNSEGGIIPEEYAVEYVVDRVETTATVWLGLTLGCARCHDHKFDPLTQREFYQFFAFFNNVPEKGRAIKVGNSPPMIKAPTRDQQKQLRELDDRLATAESRLAAMQNEIAAGEARWCGNFTSSEPIDWSPSEDLIAHYSMDEGRHEPVDQYSQGVINTAASFQGDKPLDAGQVANFGYFDKFTFSAWVRPQSDTGTLLARMASEADSEGYSVLLKDGKLQVNLVKRWLDDSLRVETRDPLALDQWHHVAVVYDGSRLAGGVSIFIDGKPQTLVVLLDELNQSFNSTEPLRIGGGGPGPAFNGLIDEVRVYKRDLAPAEVELLATPETINAIVALNASARSPRQSAKLRGYYLARQAPRHVEEAQEQVNALHKQRSLLEESFPTTMVMQEMTTPRATHILARGQYDKPLEQVAAGVPASLNPLPPGVPRDRLSLARWLVDPENPLAARVAVNRFWQSYFGAGLVKTVADFGSQSEAPSNAALLDWLACEFMSSGWDMKALQRLIVTSATYRQSSQVTPQLLERDPENRLLARGPRCRLPAEVIRDSALAASGLLVEQLGGPSVNPYQPPGLWKELTGGADFVQDHGENLYRRSLYTFWKRTIAPPSMMTFDASSRDACTVRETRTNTPLQALALLNEVTFVEAARVMAERAMAEGGQTPGERIALMFRLTLARAASDRELNVLASNFERQLRHFREHPASAAKLLRVGEEQRDRLSDDAELAAYTAVANLILNLDEAVTKE